MRKAGPVLMTILGVGAFVAALLVGLFVAGSLSRCTNVQANVFVWPRAVHCTTPPPAVVVSAVDEIIGRDGLEDEVHSESIAELVSLARDVGGETVVCALSELLGDYSASPSRMVTMEQIQRRSRIEHFLADNNITVFRTVR